MDTRSTVRSRLCEGEGEDNEREDVVQEFQQDVAPQHEPSQGEDHPPEAGSLGNLVEYWDGEREACLGEFRRMGEQQSRNLDNLLPTHLGSFNSTIQRLVETQTAILLQMTHTTGLQVEAGSVQTSQPNPETLHATCQASHGSAQKKTEFKPMPFNGSEDWESYKLQFSAIADKNGWDESTKTVALMAALYGPAREVIAQVGSSASFDALVTALEARFGFQHQEQRFMTLLMTRVQEGKEDLSTFHHSLRTLARRALPEISPGTESMLVHLFIRGLKDQALRGKVLTIGPKSMNEAIAVALRMETVQQVRPQAVRQLAEVQEEDKVSRAVPPSDPDKSQTVDDVSRVQVSGKSRFFRSSPTARWKGQSRYPRFMRTSPPVCWRCGLEDTWPGYVHILLEMRQFHLYIINGNHN
uniref:Putative ribose/galactose/methyl galactoside import ATP-binding protein n=1 Tax=Lygus hesperus TaxID=30085 RepID=A0A0A9YDH8_LYGHE